MGLEAGASAALPQDGGMGLSSGAEDQVALEALAEPDETDQMIPPEVGSPVIYQVSGTVTRIEGDQAYVRREAVNGKPVGSSKLQAPSANDDGELAGLRSQAAELGGF